MWTARSNEVQTFNAERFHPRVEANFMVRLIVRGRLEIAKASNLSMAGLYLLNISASPGERMTVSIPLPGDTEVLTHAHVSRVDEGGAAVEFDPLDWEDLIALARFLHPRLP